MTARGVLICYVCGIMILYDCVLQCMHGHSVVQSCMSGGQGKKESGCMGCACWHESYSTFVSITTGLQQLTWPSFSR
jgi:hypothetical protein